MAHMRHWCRPRIVQVMRCVCWLLDMALSSPTLAPCFDACRWHGISSLNNLGVLVSVVSYAWIIASKLALPVPL